MNQHGEARVVESAAEAKTSVPAIAAVGPWRTEPTTTEHIGEPSAVAAVASVAAGTALHGVAMEGAVGGTQFAEVHNRAAAGDFAWCAGAAWRTGQVDVGRL